MLQIINQKLKSIIIKFSVFILSGMLSFLIVQLFHFNLDFSKLIFFLDEYTRLSFLSVYIVLLLQLPIIILVNNVFLGTVITLSMSIIIGFSNYQKMLYRPEPLYPSDVNMLKNIKFLFFSVEMKERIIAIIVLIFISILLFFIVKKVYSNQRLTKNNIIIRSFAFLFSLTLLYPIVNFGKSDSTVKTTIEEFGKASWIPFNQVKNYDRNGFVAGVLYNLNSEVIYEPEKYSKETIKGIVEKYTNIALDENKNRNGSMEDVNIVYIMNESFADPLELKGWSINQDPLPYYRSLKNEFTSGQMLSQGYGGGTANIEFEALTGISMEPMLPSLSIAYTQLTNKMTKVPSILSYFNGIDSNNHKKTAIHPFHSSMYKRPEVYNNLGFDKIIFEDDMDFDMKLESSLYISDESSYKQVFKEMEESKENDFIHLVTMQGHGPYHVGYFGNLNNFEIEGPIKKMDMLNYLSSLYYSDKALKKYVEKTEKMDEKVITVFWGDHLPSAISYGVTSLNEPIQKYLTPVFIHSNFETENKDLGIISPIYYANELLDITNSKLTGYYTLLNELRKFLPAFEKEFHVFQNVGNIGTNRIYNNNTKASTILNDYEMLIYDIFEGEEYFKELGFFEIVK